LEQPGFQFAHLVAGVQQLCEEAVTFLTEAVGRLRESSAGFGPIPKDSELFGSVLNPSEALALVC
jgi:hypothetical protein